MKRFVKFTEANIVNVGTTVIREYFHQKVPIMGLATALFNGIFPPENLGYWSRNNFVDEYYYAISGTGKVIFEDGETCHMEANSAVFIPRGIKFRVEDE